MRTKNPFLLIFFFILATIPIIFGARHPLAYGLYSFIILVTSGTWIIFNFEKVRPSLLYRTAWPPLIIITFIIFTSLSLPFFILEIISPTRAHSISQAVNIAQLKNSIQSLSYYAPSTRFYGIYMLGLYGYYFFSSQVIRQKKVLRTLLRIFLFVGLFEALYGLLQTLDPSVGVLWLPSIISAEGSARGTIIYRNQYAALLNMCWPMTLTAGILLYKPVIEKFEALKQRKKKLSTAERISFVMQKPSLLFWATGLIMLAVLFSRSRGGIIVMTITAALLLFFLPFSKKIKTISGLSFSLYLLAYGSLIGFQNIIDRFYLFREGALGRIELWRSSVAMLMDHLFTGIGMGAYQFVSPIYLRQMPGRVWYDFAHNEYLELLIELGLPAALLLFVWMTWGIMRNGTRIFYSTRYNSSLGETSENLIIAIGSFCALNGFLLHGFVDFTWRLPVNALYAVTLLAILNTSLSIEHLDEN